MTQPTCPGSGERAAVGIGRPVCPVCHRTTYAGLPRRFPKRGAKLIVPEHPAPLTTRTTTPTSQEES